MMNWMKEIWLDPLLMFEKVVMVVVTVVLTTVTVVEIPGPVGVGTWFRGTELVVLCALVGTLTTPLLVVVLGPGALPLDAAGGTPGTPRTGAGARALGETAFSLVTVKPSLRSAARTAGTREAGTGFSRIVRLRLIRGCCKRRLPVVS